MAKKSGFDFSGMFKDIENRIIGVLADKGNQGIGQEIFANATRQLVYPLYHKTQYKRRMESGGLADPKNYEIESTGLSTTITNNTESNYNQPHPSGGFINDIIESGTGYEWTRSEIYEDSPWPRPFMDEAAKSYAEYLLTMIDIVVFNGDGNGVASA